MSSLEAACSEFSGLCFGGKLDDTPGVKVSSATFQPVAARVNQDSMVFQTWEIMGQKWIFLAVCDGERPHGPARDYVVKLLPEHRVSVGHSGSNITADYTIAALPPRLQASLQDVLINRLHEQVERETLLQNASLISSALGREVERFDKGLGKALKKICPHPENLTEAQSEELVRVHDDIIQRAYRGCTLGVALINVATRCMWTLNVGDTTVGKHIHARMRCMHYAVMASSKLRFSRTF